MRAPLLGTVDGTNAKSDLLSSLQLDLGKCVHRAGALKCVAELFVDNKFYPPQLLAPWKPWGQRRDNHAICLSSMCAIRSGV